MFNPIRRNKNIGTENQGFGQDNKHKISTPYGSLKSFYERIGKYHKEIRIINDHEFVFIEEETRGNCYHTCTFNDIEKVIREVPKEDYGDLKFIILRQSKRKEEIVSSVWGRLIYSFEFENEYFPAIILDAIDLNKRLVWSRKLTVDDQKEFERLKEDGHIFTENKRYFVADLKLDQSRSTQLYRTLLHEFGHYVHYLEVVERLGNADENNKEKDARENFYFSLPKAEKEKFANKYADNLKAKMTFKKIIPFESK